MPRKPKNIEDFLEEEAMQRSVHRLDDSTLSHRLSHIPKDRAGTNLSSVEDSLMGQMRSNFPGGGGLITVRNMDIMMKFDSHKSPARKSDKRLNSMIS